MKNSFSLFELILTLIISTIIIIYSTLYTKELFQKNQETQQIEIDKINFLSTKIFIEKHKYEIENLSFSNNNLYFKNSLLLGNVKEFNVTENSNKINVYINLKDKIIQTWIFEL